MMKLTSVPLDEYIARSSEDVVVLPWVPATPTADARAQMEASISALVRTRSPADRAATNSMLSRGIADENVTASRSATSRAS